MKYCVISDPLGGPDLEYILGTYPNAERECMNAGGRVVERDDSDACGSTKSIQPRDVGLRLSAATAAVVAPIQHLRERLPDSRLLRDLALVNYSPDLLRAVDDDPRIREGVREAVGAVSQFALLALIDPHSPTLAHARYTEELHAWFSELGELIQKQAKDEAVREAIDRIRETLEPQVGNPIGALVERAFSGGVGAV
jgi:hypothetical protein